MALKSTVYKADLSVADLDRNVYADFPLTLALHPSETEERLMVRLIAFALFADEQLTFGPGISNPEEPDLWLRDLTGRIERWIEVGLPDDKQIGRASGRADEVVVVAYGRGVDMWWKGIEAKLVRFPRLSVLRIDDETCKEIVKLVARNMKLAATLQEGHVLLAGDAGSVDIAIETLKAPEAVR